VLVIEQDKVEVEQEIQQVLDQALQVVMVTQIQ
jgi:hypothetical protein